MCGLAAAGVESPPPCAGIITELGQKPEMPTYPTAKTSSHLNLIMRIKPMNYGRILSLMKKVNSVLMKVLIAEAAFGFSAWIIKEII
jgi:hypothetical protein